MSPGRRSAALVVIVAVGAGCGGAHRAASPHPPALPRDVATRLATLSDEVAKKLDAGDDCGALDSATALGRQTADAIDRGQVPVPLQQPLRSATDDLATRIQCIRPKEHGKGKHKDHKHGEGD